MIRTLTLLLLLSWHSLSAQTNIITTICGNGTAGFAGDGGPAVNAHVNWPCALCIDNLGNIYFADADNHRIRKINKATGIITTVAGNGTPGFNGDGIIATTAELFVPEGIAIDAANNIYIADGLNHRIRKVEYTTGFISTVAGSGTAGFSGDGGSATAAQINGPAGIFVDKSYNLYIADYWNNRVRKVNLTTGIISTVAGSGGSGYSGDGGPATNAEFAGASNVSVDTAGNIYCSDQYNGSIRKITVGTGIISTVVGSGVVGYGGDGGPAIAAKMNEPQGIFIDHAGNMFIADYRNGAIRKVDASGIITTVAGGAPGYFGDNGPATSAKLKCTDVALDRAGNMIIADYVNMRIRKVQSAVSVNEVSRATFSVYPNPVVNNLNVLSNDISGSARVTLFDISGAAIKTFNVVEEQTVIDISALAPAVYTICLESNGEKMWQKVVKL